MRHAWIPAVFGFDSLALLSSNPRELRTNPAARINVPFLLWGRRLVIRSARSLGETPGGNALRLCIWMGHCAWVNLQLHHLRLLMRTNVSLWAGPTHVSSILP